MKIYASRNSGGFTLGMLKWVLAGNTEVNIFGIYEDGNAESISYGYLDNILRRYPELTDCTVIHIQAEGVNKLDVDIKVSSDTVYPHNALG